ncbi:hypothetical protein PPYR_01101 [Photinus pyralis]|uniref:DUF4729 domain-containing protein n=1 Tax=Photinus pyralis TaxID=7054 RepID=A0A5N4B3D7_PHOPY|nr:uncharacterized protein LOC116175580 isoform X2 [Photinus pyralis]KAB0804131.1 hypothetical protein PPYR_01101 [Photinus pyralis]
MSHTYNDKAALYKCNMGKHPICYTCFLRASKNGNPLCPKCNSLVMKTSSSAIFKRSENVTVEKLFQLPTEKINALLYRSTEKLNDATEKHWAPIKCPHSPCGKTVNPSSLHSHFIYEHSNIPIYQLTRGSELQVLTELSHLEHGASRCIGLIELLPSGCSFCILASASEECDPLLGYAVYWLVTNSQKQYQCTLETLSPSKASSCATFCKVIEARNNSSITAIIKAMGCLFLSYGTVKNLADDFGKLHLCIVIH